MENLSPTELKGILHSKRANLYYLEHCRVLVNGGRVEYVTDEGKRSLYWNIPIANTTTVNRPGAIHSEMACGPLQGTEIVHCRIGSSENTVRPPN